MWTKARALLILAVAMAVANPAAGPAVAQQGDDRQPIRTTTNAVIAWNAHAGDASLAACFIGNFAPEESRMYAMMHVAIHDALNGIERHSKPYAASLRVTSATSPDAAVAAAARDVLVPVLTSFSFFLPAECISAGVSSVEADYAAALAAIPDGAAKTRGVALGHAAAAVVLALRSVDGFDSPTIDPSYQEGTAPGEYRYTPGTPYALSPGLAQMTPWVLDSAGQFRPGPPYTVTSPRYTADFKEVKRLGGDGVTTASDRTADQTEIALFWVEPSPLQWNRITRTIATARGLDLWASARLFGLLDLALADGYIAAWDAKYHYRFWRPVSAIRLAGTDGNPSTVADATWTPLAPTPPIPDYDSGHAIEGAVGAQILSRFFHTDRMRFSVCSDTLPAGQTCSDASPKLRYFTRFSQAANENALSRIYVGYHFRSAVVVGTRHGEKIADWTMQHAMRLIRH